MRKKINYEKVTFLGGFGGEPPKKKEIRSLQLLCSNECPGCDAVVLSTDAELRVRSKLKVKYVS